MRKLIAGIGVAALALTMTACSSGSDESGASGDQSGSGTTGTQPWDGDASEVDVVTWWEAGSEKEGLQALQTVFEEKFPDTKFVNAAIAGGGGSQAKQKLAADLAAGNPPDTFQAHAGAELSDYIDAGQIEDLSGLYDELGLKDAFPSSLIDRLTVDGKIYSVPSNIHRANMVWANPTVLKAAGLDPEKPATTIADWITDMQKIKDAGYTPITVGMAWTQTQLLENVLMSELGAEGYNGLFDGTTKWDSAEVKQAIEDYTKIMSFTDSSLYSEDWEPAMQPVVDGKAAYNVMGDWAYLGLTSQGKTLGTDVIAFPTPGTEKMYDFLADSFTLPKGAKHPGGARNWLENISSKEGQVAFNSIKGSIPARADLSEDELSKFSDYQKDAMKSFESDEIVSSIAHGAAVPASISNAMGDALMKFAQGASDATQLQADLVSATADLSE
ncbi:ABC transporter substrate-binding protein [Actinomyces provencensis]|uniref:ABC transporter substrate-binding protein n=1 Tax=Actinomyces provencensis TaxID=1720198 RepID=UPI00096A9030|nr:ABC transporter substrate-binding protein [Actinomyces provencensis]